MLKVVNSWSGKLRWRRQLPRTFLPLVAVISAMAIAVPANGIEESTQSVGPMRIQLDNVLARAGYGTDSYELADLDVAPLSVEIYQYCHENLEIIFCDVFPCTSKAWGRPQWGVAMIQNYCYSHVVRAYEYSDGTGWSWCVNPRRQISFDWDTRFAYPDALVVSSGTSC